MPARYAHYDSRTKGSMSGQPSEPLEDFEQIRRYIKGAVIRACPGWSPDDVEEVTHHALLRLMKLSRKDRAEGGFTRPYLCRVAYTHIVDEIRRRRAVIPLELHENARGELPSPDTDPEGDCSLSELRKAIWECIQRLNRNRQHAVTLMLFGYRNSEIARLAGWGAKQAENHVTRGRADLRACLGTKGYRG